MKKLMKEFIFGPEKRMPTDENPLIIDLGSDHGYVTRKIIAKKDNNNIQGDRLSE